MTARLDSLAASVLLGEVERSMIDVLEAEVERLAGIAADRVEGRSWVGATRALFDHEVRAQVQYGDIAGDHDLTEEEVEAEIGALHVAVVAAIVAAVAGDSPPTSREQVSERLRSTRRTWPPALVLAVEEGAERLASVFRRASDRGAATAAAEAIRQGLDVDAPMGVMSARRARESAAQVADSLVDRLLLAGSSVADTVRSAPGAAAPMLDRLRGAMTETSVKQVVDDARQVTHHVYGEGRVATADTLPAPKSVYASELLDGATCDNCSTVDGREYESIAAAMEDYPDGGPYYACHGGSRCRGTLVFEWT